MALGKIRSTSNAAVSLFSKFFGYANLGFYRMKLPNNAKYILLRITMMQFWYMQLSRGRCYSVFQKILVVILFSDCVARNRTKFCMQHTYFTRWYWCNFCEQSLLLSYFFQNFGEKQTLCFSEWNWANICMQDVHYYKQQVYILNAYSSFEAVLFCFF